MTSAQTAFELSVSQFTRTLTNLDTILEKAAAQADTKKYDVNNLLTMRLAPDMLPFTKQIQIACDAAKGVVRLAGQEVPRFEDNETTLPQLRERIQKTLTVLRGLNPENFEGWEKIVVNVPFPKGKTLPANQWLPMMAIPNFYFHTSMAYALLRSNGIEIGKGDYLGPINFQ